MLKNMSSLTNSSTKIEGSAGSESGISSSASYDSLNGDEHDERTSRDRASSDNAVSECVDDECHVNKALPC